MRKSKIYFNQIFGRLRSRDRRSDEINTKIGSHRIYMRYVKVFMSLNVNSKHRLMQMTLVDHRLPQKLATKRDLNEIKIITVNHTHGR